MCVKRKLLLKPLINSHNQSKRIDRNGDMDLQQKTGQKVKLHI